MHLFIYKLFDFTILNLLNKLPNTLFLFLESASHSLKCKIITMPQGFWEKIAVLEQLKNWIPIHKICNEWIIAGFAYVPSTM